MRVDLDINPDTVKFLILCIENQKRITENSFKSMIEDLLPTKSE
jgi:hypothetical protein